MKLKHLQVYLTLLLLTFTISCSNKQLTEDECLEAFLEMDYVEAAEFYRDNLDSQPWVPLTYHKYIVPVLEESDIFTLRELMPILDGTTAGRKIASVYLLQRNKYYQEVCFEIDELTSTAKETFIEEIMPLIELSLDSIMEADVHQAVDKYCGGIMNFRKLGLLFDSDNMGKLITCCKENILSIHFEACIQSYFTEYLQTIHDIQSEYLEKFTGEKLAMDFHPITVTFDVPNEVSFNKSRENITSLNAKEIEDVWSEIARTGIDIGASFLSGGISLVYDCASFAYDAYDIYQSFNTQELEFNEVLELLLCDIFNEDMADEIQSLKEIMSYHLENNAEKIKLTLKESL